MFRLASGSHQRWDWPMPDGETKLITRSTYPRSSGLVLQVIGHRVEELCANPSAVQAVRAAKLARFGPHPSALPGYQPPWRIAYEKAKLRAAGLRRP
jgi:hypothetical protein